LSKRILCRCEDVTVDEFRKAYHDGFTEMESLKRFTGVATGFCQGKGCVCDAALELADLRHIDPAEIRLVNIRPPAEPLTFAELASLETPAFIGQMEADRDPEVEA
jgi:sarcosine oxidase subunit beta